jgi:hypothetical protein
LDGLRLIEVEQEATMITPVVDDTDTVSNEHGLENVTADKSYNCNGNGGTGNDNDNGRTKDKEEFSASYTENSVYCDGNDNGGKEEPKGSQDNGSNDNPRNKINNENGVRNKDALLSTAKKKSTIVESQQSLLQYSQRQESSTNQINNDGGPFVLFDQTPSSSSGYFLNQYHQFDHGNPQHILQQQSTTHHHIPPPPPSGPTMMQLPSSTTDLDAARQYYEARMREHALQYANAAAGAAWAAARIACSATNFSNIINDQSVGNNNNWGGENNIGVMIYEQRIINHSHIINPPMSRCLYHSNQ